MTEESLLRRWIDKVVCGAIACIIGLMSLAYAGVKSELSQAREKAETAYTRAGAIDQHLIDIDRRLERIENKIDVLGGREK